MALIEIQVPDIGDFDEVTVIELLVKAGDVVKAEQSLMTVESDKASMEIPCSQAGVVKELKVKIGDKVAEGSLLLILETSAAAAPAATQDPELVRTKLQEVVDGWWDDEPEDLREDLRDELRGSHGIPQEVDRHMLLRVRRALNRPLSFPEKKILREMVRNKVLGITEESLPA